MILKIHTYRFHAVTTVIQRIHDNLTIMAEQNIKIPTK